MPTQRFAACVCVAGRQRSARPDSEGPHMEAAMQLHTRDALDLTDK